jgi:hypothetical protein
MRNRGRLTLALASVIVVLVIGAFAYVLHARSQPQTTTTSSRTLPSYTPVPLVCPGPPDTMSERGSPAIHPRNDCTPAFTQQDMRDYLAQGIPLGKIEVIGQPTVEQVVFLTIRDLGQQTGDSDWVVNYPADLVVCYVALHGTFRVFGPPSANHSSHTVSNAFIVFDAHTGNLFAVGAGP